MKNVLAAAAVATGLLAGAALPAMADTIGFPPPSSNPANNVVSFPAGNFVYDYSFAFTSPMTIDGISASSSSTTGSGKNTRANLFFTSVEVFGPTGAPIVPLTTISGQSFNVYPGVDAAAGSYRVEIKGRVTAGVGSFNGNLSVSSVPLPSSVAMFGTALIGLAAVGGVGAMRRKSASISA